MTVRDEYVFNVYKTRTQYGVKRYDGRGYVDGAFTMPDRRYFDTEEQANKWAENKAEEIGGKTRIVYLGEHV